jgi:hypothetical protein
MTKKKKSIPVGTQNIQFKLRKEIVEVVEFLSNEGEPASFKIREILLNYLDSLRLPAKQRELLEEGLRQRGD